MRALGLLPAIGLMLLIADWSPLEAAEETPTEQANQGTVGIMTGELGGSDIRIGADLTNVLDEGDLLRVLPILGQGSLKNINDLLYLRGIDMAIVQADALSLIQRLPHYQNLKGQLNFVSKLYGEEVHVLARRSIGSIKGLEGRRVNFVSEDSGNFITGQFLLQTFGVRVEPVFTDTAEAIEMMKKGAIDATVLVTGKPAGLIRSVQLEDDLHLLPVSVGQVSAPYRKVELAAADYPGLIEPGRSIETIAVSSVLMVYNWQSDHWRYAKVARFVDAFLGRFDEFLQPPRDAKWSGVDLAAAVDGWSRFPPVENWLRDNAVAPSTAVANAPSAGVIESQDAALAQNPSLRRDFRQFLEEQAETVSASTLSQLDREQLFERFIIWQRERAIEDRNRAKTPTF